MGDGVLSARIAVSVEMDEAGSGLALSMLSLWRHSIEQFAFSEMHQRYWLPL